MDLSGVAMIELKLRIMGVPPVLKLIKVHFTTPVRIPTPTDYPNHDLMPKMNRAT